MMQGTPIARAGGRRIDLVLGAICLAFGCAMLYQLTRSPPDDTDLPGPAGSRAAPPAAAPATAVMPPIDMFADFVARPLFLPTRRPAPSAAVAASAKAAPAPVSQPTQPPSALNQVTLVGVTITPEGASALLRPAGATKLVRVHEGESFQGWTVRHIKSGSVSFASASGETDLKFPTVSASTAARPVSPGQAPMAPSTPLARRDAPAAPMVTSMPMGAPIPMMPAVPMAMPTPSNATRR